MEPPQTIQILTQTHNNEGTREHRRPKIWGHGLLNGREVYFWGREHTIHRIKYAKNQNVIPRTLRTKLKNNWIVSTRHDMLDFKDTLILTRTR